MINGKACNPSQAGCELIQNAMIIDVLWQALFKLNRFGTWEIILFVDANIRLVMVRLLQIEQMQYVHEKNIPSLDAAFGA